MLCTVGVNVNPEVSWYFKCTQVGAFLQKVTFSHPVSSRSHISEHRAGRGHLADSPAPQPITHRCSLQTGLQVCSFPYTPQANTIITLPNIRQELHLEPAMGYVEVLTIYTVVPLQNWALTKFNFWTTKIKVILYHQRLQLSPDFFRR